MLVAWCCNSARYLQTAPPMYQHRDDIFSKEPLSEMARLQTKEAIWWRANGPRVFPHKTWHVMDCDCERGGYMGKHAEVKVNRNWGGELGCHGGNKSKHCVTLLYRASRSAGYLTWTWKTVRCQVKIWFNSDFVDILFGYFVLFCLNRLISDRLGCQIMEAWLWSITNVELHEGKPSTKLTYLPVQTGQCDMTVSKQVLRLKW